MAIHQDSNMKNSKRRLLGATVLAAACLPSLAWSANCQWVPAGGPTMKNYQRDMGTLYVPRDARPGTVIGAIDLAQSTSSNPGFAAECVNDGSHYLLFSARATVPIFPGPLDPIDGEDVTGKIMQTNIPGIGVRVKLGTPLDGRGDNSFVPIGPPTVPYDGFNDKMLLTQIRLNNLTNRVTLVKTGPLPAGAHILDGRELFSGHFPDLGKVFGFGLTGTIITAQCSVSANPVSADPVPLGEWEKDDFKAPGYTTTAIPFSITLNACETDTRGGFTATANIQLDGVKGSTPIGPVSNGVFSLTSDSTAKGIGIQILRADGTTPVELQTEVPLIAISPGNTVLNFNARFYQTEPASAVQPGLAKGALNFTITYK
jgi:type 1 fimbria pilin